METGYYYGVDPIATCLASGLQQLPRPSDTDSGYPAKKHIGPIADDFLTRVFKEDIDKELEVLRRSYSTGVWLSRFFARIGFDQDNSNPAYILVMVREGSIQAEEAKDLVQRIERICEIFGCRGRIWAEVAFKPTAVPHASQAGIRLDDSYLEQGYSLKLGRSVGHDSAAGSTSVVVDGVHADGKKTRCLLICAHVAFTVNRPCSFGHKSDPTQVLPDNSSVYEEDGNYSKDNVFVPSPIDLSETIDLHEKAVRARFGQAEHVLRSWTEKRSNQQAFGYVLACSGNSYRAVSGNWATDWALVKPYSPELLKEVNELNAPEERNIYRLFKQDLFSPPTKLAPPLHNASTQEYPKVVCKIGRTTDWTAGRPLEIDVITYQDNELIRAQSIACSSGREVFSEDGDSGSLVFDSKGRPWYYVIAGTDSTRYLKDVTYAVPIDVVEKDIKKTLGWSRVEIVGLT